MGQGIGIAERFFQAELLRKIWSRQEEVRELSSKTQEPN